MYFNYWLLTGWYCGNYTEDVTLSKDPIIFLWDKDANIIDYISSDKPHSRYLFAKHGQPKRDLVIYNHNMGESSCAEWIQDLIKLGYKKKPNSLVISFDFSGVVSESEASVASKKSKIVSFITFITDL